MFGNDLKEQLNRLRIKVEERVGFVNEEGWYEVEGLPSAQSSSNWISSARRRQHERRTRTIVESICPTTSSSSEAAAAAGEPGGSQHRQRSSSNKAGMNCHIVSSGRKGVRRYVAGDVAERLARGFRQVESARGASGRHRARGDTSHRRGGVMSSNRSPEPRPRTASGSVRFKSISAKKRNTKLMRRTMQKSQGKSTLDFFHRSETGASFVADIMLSRRKSEVLQKWSPVLERWEIAILETGDDAKHSEQFQALLQSKGHRCRSVRSGEALLNMCLNRRRALQRFSGSGDEAADEAPDAIMVPMDERHPFDVIVVSHCSSEVHHQGEDEFTEVIKFIRSLRAAKIHASVLVGTLSSSLSSKAFEEVGANAVLRYPISMSTFERCVVIHRRVDEHAWFMAAHSTLTLAPGVPLDMVARHLRTQAKQIPSSHRSVVVNAVQCEHVIELFEALFWLLFCKNFQRHSARQQRDLFSKVAKLYSKVIASAGLDVESSRASPIKLGELRDAVLQHLPIVLAEALFATFDQVFQGSLNLFDDEFRDQVHKDVIFCLTGVAVTSLSLSSTRDVLMPVPLVDAIIRRHSIDACLAFIGKEPSYGDLKEICAAVYAEREDLRRKQQKEAAENELIGVHRAIVPVPEFDVRALDLDPNPNLISVNTSVRRCKSAGYLQRDFERQVRTFPCRVQHNNCRITPVLQCVLGRSNAAQGVNLQKRTWASSHCAYGGTTTFKPFLDPQSLQAQATLIKNTKKLRKQISISMDDRDKVKREMERTDRLRKEQKKAMRSRPAAMKFCMRLLSDMQRQQSRVQKM